MGLFKTILNTVPRPILIKLSYLARPFLAFWFRGKAYTDPIDGHNYRRFLPYGYGQQRPNVLAPGTLSLERHRLLWLYLQNETSFFTAPLKVLHLAPEQCFLKRFKALKNLDYTTADLYAPHVDIKADICNLPFADAVFDVVFCNHVLEHITDDTKAMQELYRVLKPRGFGIFQIPQDLSKEKTYEDFSITSPAERTKHFGQYDHVRIYGRDYFNRLRAVGFKVQELNYCQNLSAKTIEQYRLVSDEILPVCFK
ncbi:MAG: SAM-dependent methyltransferase [Flavobacteriales bacterium CG03_land_8_20_14_0_80_35_15]|nr:MAG: SAM-dependent methyltransferase [Flavobacteriales bacterium CG11_big_fil_rev_8_21_14_0_20_35_7]PIV17215.1 MAG: SAM-dependent methyltransferase [Flavobacteriales bacterium CG03_land_8_20_14_0_80_35_15]PJA04488.1 MAG: SAM-dependent methyltransferase [Flavobacteriales bacterium CG_4_10_14_0_2_um_filter_35_18]